jgi:hypothetical protein
MKEFGKKLLRIWKAIFRPIGVFNSYLLLTVLYLFIVPIFSLKRIVDPLGLRFGKDGSYWVPRKPVDFTLDRFYRPF